MRRALALLLLLLVVALPSQAAPRQLRIAAAANVKGALDEIAHRFEARHPQIDVTVVYGSSGALYTQIANGARFDLFLSADTEYPRRLAQSGLSAGPPFKYAIGRLAVWFSSTRAGKARGLNSLTDPSIRRIAIANPRVAPYGRAAEEALRATGIYERVKDKLVFGENVEQAASFAAAGAVDAAIVGASLAASTALRAHGASIEIANGLHRPIEQGGIVVASTRDADACAQFRDFLLGSEGRGILQRHRYDVPGR